MESRVASASRSAGAKASLPEHLADVALATGLNRPLRSEAEALVLSLLFTRKRMDAVSQRFFAGQPVTEAEFNALMVLDDHRGRALKQAELAGMLLVTRLSVRDVLLRLQRKGLIEKGAHADKRARAVCLSREGERVLRAVRADYYSLIDAALAGLPPRVAKQLLDGLFALRGALRDSAR